LTSATVPAVPAVSTNACLANSATFPCWGDKVSLNSSDSEGAVNNTDAVTDPIAGTSLPASTFGEAAINLTAAGVFRGSPERRRGPQTLSGRWGRNLTGGCNGSTD